MSNLPTLYEYYTQGGVTAGLSADQSYFTLNNKNITIYSGAMNYFRVPQEYWRDRLRKIRAAGLNTVETYVPWNLHEPEPGHFDFGQGGSDFQDLLDVEKFLKTAQEEDLLAIVRPGPYICNELEFGGLPSWLLREKNMKIRTSDKTFVHYFQRYFTTLFAILTTLQFSKGGPIIAFQIENEYGAVRNKDLKYLEILRDTYRSKGLIELLFTSDTPSLGKIGMLPGVLYTANFKKHATMELNIMDKYQPGKPSMVMEYWSGWYDHWLAQHHTTDVKVFQNVLNNILKYPASVNIYMFHGGTTWGFLNGANIMGFRTDNSKFLPDTNSYDYDAPLNEAGDYTLKYYIARELIMSYNKIPIRMPTLPKQTPRIAYDRIQITHQLSFNKVISQAPHHIKSHQLLPMEYLPINNNGGQSYGYIVYRKTNLNIPYNSILEIDGYVCDTVMILINGKLMSSVLETEDDLKQFGYWKKKDSSLKLGRKEYINATLDIVVQNWGRISFGRLAQFKQLKGLWQGNVTINNEILHDWEIVPLEFKKNWTNGLTEWEEATFDMGPALYKANLKVHKRVDTFVDMRGWNNGIVMINGFVLSRYLRLGPQQAAFLPAPFLKVGNNEIVVFEHFVPNRWINFSANQIYQVIS